MTPLQDKDDSFFTYPTGVMLVWRSDGEGVVAKRVVEPKDES